MFADANGESSPSSADEGRKLRPTTRQRLFFAFATLVCTFALALVVGFVGLVKIERVLDEMSGCEERMRLALELENTVRDQYGHQANIALGEHAQLDDHSDARQRGIALARQIAQRTDDPEELAWLHKVDLALRELERMSAEPFAATSPDLRHALVSSIEGYLDGVFARQHAAMVALRTEVSATQRSMLRWKFALFAGATLFAFVIVAYISRAVARPLARLQAGARRLSHGDMDARIEIDSHDEFGALAAQFNSMTRSLKQHHERLVQSEKLASVGRLAAGVAHELNNPLTLMLGHLMLQRRNAEGRLAKDLWVIEKEALRCKEIVQDLLEFSRPAGVPDRVPVEMRELCEDVVEELKGSEPLALPRFRLQGSGTALGENSKLRQVVLNLVKNAAEAAGAEGQVWIRVAPSPQAVDVAVSDSGPGVPAPLRARIFEPFFTTKTSGTGLGLAVSRVIAVAHGGDITVREAETGGALFVLTLPCAAAGGTNRAAG